MPFVALLSLGLMLGFLVSTKADAAEDCQRYTPCGNPDDKYPSCDSYNSCNRRNSEAERAEPKNPRLGQQPSNKREPNDGSRTRGK